MEESRRACAVHDALHVGAPAVLARHQHARAVHGAVAHHHLRPTSCLCISIGLSHSTWTTTDDLSALSVQREGVDMRQPVCDL